MSTYFFIIVILSLIRPLHNSRGHLNFSSINSVFEKLVATVALTKQFPILHTAVGVQSFIRHKLTEANNV